MDPEDVSRSATYPKPTPFQLRHIQPPHTQPSWLLLHWSTIRFSLMLRNYFTRLKYLSLGKNISSVKRSNICLMLTSQSEIWKCPLFQMTPGISKVGYMNKLPSRFFWRSSNLSKAISQGNTENSQLWLGFTFDIPLDSSPWLILCYPDYCRFLSFWAALSPSLLKLTMRSVKAARASMFLVRARPPHLQATVHLVRSSTAFSMLIQAPRLKPSVTRHAVDSLHVAVWATPAQSLRVLKLLPQP